MNARDLTLFVVASAALSAFVPSVAHCAPTDDRPSHDRPSHDQPSRDQNDATTEPPTTSVPGPTTSLDVTVTTAPTPATDVSAAAAAPESTAWSTCRESVPPGKTRPTLEEKFPSQLPAGHGGVLEITLIHGKGERVLADAFELQRDSDGAKTLLRAGFEFPSTAGPGSPRVTRTERDADAITVVELTLLPLPKESGPRETTLPPLPIAIARASGEVMTICTAPHATTITDPTANVPHATPKRHPGGERQRELWVGLRNVTYGALLGLTLAGIIALIVRWFQRRPKPVPPPPPPRPAWEVALETLSQIRQADLLSQGLFTAHLERVNHALRQYLGGRYGFDGLERTTEEVLIALKASTLPTDIYLQVERMLRESDLVKFAKLVPTEADCRTVLDDVEGIVRKTMHTDAASLTASPSTATSPPEPSLTNQRLRTTSGPTHVGEAPGLGANVTHALDVNERSEDKQRSDNERSADAHSNDTRSEDERS
jgi:hypothetical protein